MSELAEFYKTSPIKRDRRTKRELGTIREALYQTLAADNPATVRQIFYRLVSANVIEKTEAAYKTTVCRLLALMRREGALPFGWIADNTRWMRKPRTYSSIEDALKRTAEFYRRALWDEQKAYVEVWLEKDALAGVLYPITAEWDVPLMVTRGYPSLSFLYAAAQHIRETDKQTFIYYLGDHDPIGVNIPELVERELREMADADITFERLAVNPEQIHSFNLQTRPTKTTDSRAKSFKGESVEVDAIPPATLRNLVNTAIVKHIDQRALEVLQIAEESERGLLASFAEHWSEPTNERASEKSV
jgi:hypothetical protein